MRAIGSYGPYFYIKIEELYGMEKDIWMAVYEWRVVQQLLKERIA